MVRKPLLLILALCGLAGADTGFTSTIKVTETDNSPSCVAGQIKFSAGSVTCSGQTATVTSGGGGGGSSSLQVTRSGVQITSPTASINFYSGDFLGSAAGTTSQMYLNPATTNYIWNSANTQTAQANISGVMNSNSEYQLDGATALTNAGTQTIMVGNGTTSGLTNGGSSNSCFGYDTCTTITNAANNTISGHRAGRVIASADHNTCSGHSSCETMTDAQTNSAYGSNSLFACTICQDNSVYGYQSGQSIVGGASNSLFGVASGDSIVNATNNSLYGAGTGGDITEGVSNSCFGANDGSTQACTGIVTGSSNTAMGNGAGGSGSQSGANGGMVFFGFQAQTLGSVGDPLVNAGAIGFKATVASSNTLRLGGTLTNAMRVDMSSFTASSGTVANQFRAGTMAGAGLSTCGSATAALAFTSTGTFACQAITGTGGASGIVSPGTFTWTNTFGLSLSTLTVSSTTNIATIANFTDVGESYINQLITKPGAGVGIGISPTLGSGTLEAAGAMSSGVRAQAPEFLGGYLLQQTSARPILSMNGTGSNYGQIGNRSADTWYLGYGTNLTSNGTDVLRWGSAPFVNVLSSMTITGAKGLTVTYGVASATATFTSSMTINGVGACLSNGTDCPAAGAGDMILASTQTVTANKTFQSGLYVSSGAAALNGTLTAVKMDGFTGNYTPVTSAATSFVPYLFVSSVTTNPGIISGSNLLSESILNLTGTPGSSGIFVYNGLNATVTVVPGDTANYNNAFSVLRAGTYIARYGGNGSINRLDGTQSVAVVLGTGTITAINASAHQVQISTGLGTILPIARGVFVERPTGTAGYTTTNTYGLFIDSQTAAAGTQTNTYGILQGGRLDLNTFNGRDNIFTYGVIAGSGTFITSLNLPNGTGPTVDATGEIAFDTTDNILKAFNGSTTEVVGFSTHCFSVNVSSGNGFASLNEPIWTAPPDMAVTLTQIQATSLGVGTTVLFQLDEATASFDAAGTDVFTVVYATANYATQTYTPSAFSNAGIAADASLVLNMPAAATSGTPRGLFLRICYKRDVE